MAAGLRVDEVRTRNRGGASGDRSTSGGSLSGYGAIRWRPGSRGTELAVRLSRGFRDPGLSARYFNGTTGRGTIVGNPDLVPETSRQVDVSVISHRGRLRWAAFGYHYRIRDLVERFESDPAADLFGFRNRGEQELYGAELEGEIDLGERLSLRASASWARGEILDDASPAAEVPAATARLALLHRPGTRWWWRVVATGSLRDDRPGPTETVTPGFLLVEASTGRKLREDLELRLVLANLTDRAYPDGPDESAPLAAGRTLTVTLTGRF